MYNLQSTIYTGEGNKAKDDIGQLVPEVTPSPLHPMFGIVRDSLGTEVPGTLCPPTRAAVSTSTKYTARWVIYLFSGSDLPRSCFLHMTLTATWTCHFVQRARPARRILPRALSCHVPRRIRPSRSQDFFPPLFHLGLVDGASVCFRHFLRRDHEGGDLKCEIRFGWADAFALE